MVYSFHLTIWSAIVDIPFSTSFFTYLSDQNNAGELIAAIEERRTLEKLGGGKNSLFSAVVAAAHHSVGAADGGANCFSNKGASGGKQTAPLVDTLLKKLNGMGLNEQVEENGKIFIFTILF